MTHSPVHPLGPASALSVTIDTWSCRKPYKDIIIPYSTIHPARKAHASSGVQRSRSDETPDLVDDYPEGRR